MIPEVEGIMANPLGFVVYGGSTSVGTPEDPFQFDLSLWFSPDGRDWLELGPSPEMADSYALGGAASNGRFVVLGDHDLEPASWVSDDGVTWSRHSPGLDQDATITEVASDGTSFLAIGRQESGPDSLPAAWTSADGIDWHEVAVPNVEELTAVAGGPNGFTALSSDRDETMMRKSFSAWQLVGDSFEPAGKFVDQVCCQPLAVAADAAQVVTVGAGDCDDGLIAAAWSLDLGADTWQRAAHTADLDESYLWAVTATDVGFAAAGTRGREFSASRVGVWTSADGASWQLRTLLTDEQTWLVGGIASNGMGTALVGQYLASPLEPAPPVDDTVDVWFLPAGASAGDDGPRGPAESTGCDVPSLGTGWSAADLESNFTTSSPLTFETVDIGGRQVRKGTNPTGTVEVLLFGDPTDIERIEVRGRNTETEGGVTAFAVYWLLDDAWFNAMLDVEEGVRDHAEDVVSGLAVTFDRIDEGQWQFKFVGVPAPPGAE